MKVAIIGESPADEAAYGVLAEAVRLFAGERVALNGNRTVVFRG